jgi:adenine deaminase
MHPAPLATVSAVHTPEPLTSWITRLPKAELHLHIEGSLEPELMFALAQRNHIALPYHSVADVRAAYEFSNLQSFLDIYYAGASVLITEQDFFDLTWAYLERAHADGVIHAELFFDPQTHTARGIDIGVVISGIRAAQRQASTQWGMSGLLILCFLRHLSEAEALATLEEAKPYLSEITGVGLDSSELGHPPEKFARVFAVCKELGLRCVAHAGEEGPPAYIWGALQSLQVERIDHGVQASKDPGLIQYLAQTQIPLTVCPLSNIKLCVFESMQKHNLKDMLNAGLCVTINSDDPAYFGGYIAQNYVAITQALCLSQSELVTLARNSLTASFAQASLKKAHLQRLDDFVRTLGL